MSTDSSTSVSATWDHLQPILDSLVRPTLADTPSYASYMTTYVTVYKCITAAGSTNMNILYDRIDKYYSDVAREIALTVPTDNSTLLAHLVDSFNNYSHGAGLARRVMKMVERVYVTKSARNGRGWIPHPDSVDIPAALSDSQRDIRQQLRVTALREWGYEGTDTPSMKEAEAYAEAGSPPHCVVHLQALAHRHFRIEVIEPLLESLRLASAIKELLELEVIDEGRRRGRAGELAIVLRNVGIKPNHPLRRQLDSYIPFVNPRI